MNEILNDLVLEEEQSNNNATYGDNEFEEILNLKSQISGLFNSLDARSDTRNLYFLKSLAISYLN